MALSPIFTVFFSLTLWIFVYKDTLSLRQGHVDNDFEDKAAEA